MGNNSEVVESATNPTNSSGMEQQQGGSQRLEAPLQEAPSQGQQAPTQGQEAPTQQETPTQGQEVLKRKPSRPPSSAWAHFTRQNDNRAVCNYCKKSYACNSSSHGTSNLKKHSMSCSKNPNREVDKRQKTLALGKESEDASTVSFKLVDFNQERTRVALARMIIIDEQPFKFVEGQGFREFMLEAQPKFKVPSRQTIARECMQLFESEKEKLKAIFSQNDQMVSLTTDCWTSIQNMNYICVTAHYIDVEWKLNKKILSFGLITDHKGDTIGKHLEKCLKDWGISKICCVTVDNASANNLAISYLVRGMSDWNAKTLLNGEYMHMRCCAHILNLIVSDGLKEIDSSISRVRAACKFVKGSSVRLATFKRCAKEANIPSQAMLTVDCPTRWNSTYLMLEVAEKYEKAFSRLEYEDPAYLINLESEGGSPNNDDWARVRVFVKFLKIFYDATLSFSGSLYVTSNAFFHKLKDIQKILNKWRQSNDVILQRMTKNMQVKFNKYWESSSINFLLFVAVFLDPRYKLEYLEFCFKRMYGADQCNEMIKKLKDLINKLVELYMAEYPIDESSSVASSVASQVNVGNDGDDDVDNDPLEDEKEFRMNVKKKQGQVKRNELERYLEDDVEDNPPGFDILQWWKLKSTKYYVLSHMARDILAVPVSTVASESAFSTGGRVLDPFRSCLNPTTVEALVCTQNWIKAGKTIDLQAEMDQVAMIGAVLEEPEASTNVQAQPNTSTS